MGRKFVCAIGRGGIREDKREGDGATPVGRYQIVDLFARPDRAGPIPISTAPIGPMDLWCDDPKHPLYNSHARAPLNASHERMHRVDHLYDLVAVLDYNWPIAIPGAGSAIFMHIWRRPRFPTAGCVAFRHADFAWILKNWTPRSRVIIKP